MKITHVLIPASYTPPNDLMARWANWLLRETTNFYERSQLGFWISVPKKKGQRLFGGNWSKVVRFSESTGLTERHHSYSTRYHFSKAFRLAEQHRKSTEIAKFKLSRAINRPNKHNYSLTGRWLARSLEKFNLPYIEPTSLWHAFTYGSIRHKLIYRKQCRYGRFHSPFTTLPKSVRKMLVCEGYQLASIDIRCSQPTLLDALLHEHHPSAALLSEVDDIYEHLLPIIRQCAPYRDYLKEQIVPSSGAKKGKRLVTSKAQTPSNWTRDDVKKNVIRCLFGRTSDVKRQPAYIALTEMFPAHVKFLEEIKQSNHKDLAHRLQRMESSIVIEDVCNRLMRKHYDMPVLTIHDELILPVELVEETKELLNKAFKQQCVNAKIITTIFGDNREGD